MRNKGLFVLSGATLVVLVAAGWAVRSRSAAGAASDEERGVLFAGLEERVNDVTELFVQDAESSATLRRESDGSWVLVERGGYPARFEKVKEAVLGIARLEIEEPKSKKPENHAQLGVQDPETEGAGSKRVVLRAAGGEELARLILGEPQFRSGSQAVYARRDGEDQVYLCTGRITVETDTKSWIESEILRLESDRVQNVRILHHDGEEVLIGRDPENHTQFVVENLPPGREPSFAGVANSVGTALSYLGLDDVRAAEEVDFTAEPLARTSYHCPDGLVIEVETAKLDEKTWARLSASYEAPAETIGPVPEPPPPQVADQAEDEPQAADQAEDESSADDQLQVAPQAAPQAADQAADESPAELAADAPDPEAIRAEVEELNGRLSAWAYAIPDYKGEVLARRMEDLLADVAEELVPTLFESGEALDLDELFGTAAGDEPAAVEPPVEEQEEDPPSGNPEDG